MTLPSSAHGPKTAVTAALLAVVFFFALGFWPGPGREPPKARSRPARPTEGIRRRHALLRLEIDRFSDAVAGLPAASPGRQAELMDSAVRFLRERVLPHAEEQERTLYPVVEAQVGHWRQPFTSSLRHEHRILERWARELEEMACAGLPDPSGFARLAERLAGFLIAHGEVEEEVLYPVLDRTMRVHELDRAGDPGTRRE
jgi:hemerythrin-like domain-containing protein